MPAVCRIVEIKNISGQMNKRTGRIRTTVHVLAALDDDLPVLLSDARMEPACCHRQGSVVVGQRFPSLAGEFVVKAFFVLVLSLILAPTHQDPELLCEDGHVAVQRDGQVRQGWTSVVTR